MMAPTTTIERAAKERPILMSAPMVRQILDGKKTQTRRVVKLTEGGWLRKGRYATPVDPAHGPMWRPHAGAELQPMPMERVVSDFSPYGEPGDHLWVREAWRTSIICDDKPGGVLETPGNGYGWPVWYEADGGAVTWRGSTGGGPGFVNPGRYRHARFMPRWASRLTLDVINVRVERLHDITDKDILAEGVTVPIVAAMTGIPWAEIPDLFSAWRLGWIHINGAESWESNPWVWRVAFRRVEVSHG